MVILDKEFKWLFIILNITMVRLLTCEKCGHTWIPRVEKPRQCSHCGHWFYVVENGELVPIQRRRFKNRPRYKTVKK